MAPDRMLRAALRYAAFGWAVVPIWWPDKATPTGCSCFDSSYVRSRECNKPGKHPIGVLVPHGVRDATIDIAAIHDWWGRWPDANLGIAAGATSGIVILDIDGRNGGFESLEMLVSQHGELPPTLTAQTGSGGLHLFFEYSGELIKRNDLYPGVDLLSTGGYAVAAPSLHPCGRRYRWRADVLRIARPPEWLVEAVRTRRPSPARSTAYRTSPGVPRGGSTRYGLHALASEAEALAATTRGARNRVLNATAFSLGRLVVAGHLVAEEVEEALLEASGRNGYLGEEGERAVRRVIVAGMTAGMEAGARGPSLSVGARGPGL